MVRDIRDVNFTNFILQFNDEEFFFLTVFDDSLNEFLIGGDVYH